MKNLNNEKIKIFISEKPDGSMKLLGDFGDDKILDNRKRFFKKNRIDFEKVISANLVHGVNVEVVGNKDEGKFIEKTDGFVTKKRDVFLTVTVADCLPVFLWTEKTNGVGILHAGWRSVVGGIVEEGIEKLKNLVGCKFDEIFLKIGPSIRPCCFEVGDKVLKSFEEFPEVIEVREDQKYINLQKVVKQIALKRGLLEKNIDVKCVCTSCASGKYFSYRRDKPKKIQAMMAGIGIV